MSMATRPEKVPQASTPEPKRAAASREAAPEASVRQRLLFSLVLIQAEAEKAVLQITILGHLRHGSGMDYATVVHHRDSIAERFCNHKVLLHQQNGRVGRLQLAEC